MYVSKMLIAAIAVVGALTLGWLGNDFVSHLAAAASATPGSSEEGSLVSSGIAPVQADPLFASSQVPVAPEASQPPLNDPPAASADGPTNIYLTIVNTPPGVATTVPTITGTAPTAADGVSQGRIGETNRQLRTTSSAGASADSTRLVVGGRAANSRNEPSSNPKSSSTRGVAEGIVLQLSPQSATTAIGEHIVIAYDGAIVYVGDNGSMTANSGDAIGGGTVAMNSDSSTFSSNYDPTVIVPNGTIAAPGSGHNASSASALHSGAGSSGATPSATTDHLVTTVGGVIAGGSPSAIPDDASPLVSAFISYTGNRTADIAGFEDHSVLTRGTGNVVTYDDSNVLINRNGKINANTGDTDSAGLNAIATLRSKVSAGPHCDDGCDDESIIQAQAGVFDEGDVAIDGNGNVVWAPDAADEGPSDDDSEDDSLPGDNGDDSDAADDESDDGDVSDPAEPAETREEADSTRPAADNGPEPNGNPAPGALIVGGDGIDDLSERVDGNFNVSTYDDSNVIIGGTGDVNAQIGDSDTGGTVTMDTVDSTVSGGNSR